MYRAMRFIKFVDKGRNMSTPQTQIQYLIINYYYKSLHLKRRMQIQHGKNKINKSIDLEYKIPYNQVKGCKRLH